MSASVDSGGDWVEKILEAMSQVDGWADLDGDSRDDIINEIWDKIGEEPKPQWTQHTGGIFSIAGSTVGELPAGYYELVSAQGTLFLTPVHARSDVVLRFPDAATDRVVDGIERFWTREKVFEQFGLPYKRGILLYGPPGSGKTSTLQLVARDVVNRGGIVLLWDSQLFLPAYRQIRLVQPNVPIVVLMEDLDAILERGEPTILNILDGAHELQKVVFVATTNYPEKLGPRIINRPSRFDMRIRVSHPNDAGRKMYLEHLLEGQEKLNVDVDQYVRDTRGMSLAHLKELFVSTILIGTPYDEALQALKEMHLDQATSADDTREFAGPKEERFGTGGWL